jgi:hypothetical protein
MTYMLSRHAALRVQQRGVRPNVLDVIMANAEFSASVGSGCSVIRMNSRQLKDPALRQHGERLHRLSVILSDATGEIVTVLRPRRGSVGRRYRRGTR